MVRPAAAADVAAGGDRPRRRPGPAGAWARARCGRGTRSPAVPGLLAGRAFAVAGPARGARNRSRRRGQEPRRRCRPHARRRLGGARHAPAGRRRPRLVPRPGHRPRGAPDAALAFAHRPPRRDGHGQREVGVGALPPPPPHRAGGRLVAHVGRPVRRGRRRPAAVVVGREPVPVSGIHWTSGIELGVRLTSWVWVRRLLDDWPGVADLFEDNPMALVQIRWHQEYLAAFRSRGSSANNHVVAEAVGRLVAACAFPWFAESDGLASRRGPRAGARARGEHLPERREPGAGQRLPPVRHRAGPGRPRRGARSRGIPLPGATWSTAGLLVRRGGGDARRDRPPAASG